MPTTGKENATDKVCLSTSNYVHSSIIIIKVVGMIERVSVCLVETLLNGPSVPSWAYNIQ